MLFSRGKSVATYLRYETLNIQIKNKSIQIKEAVYGKQAFKLKNDATLDTKKPQ